MCQAAGLSAQTLNPRQERTTDVICGLFLLGLLSLVLLFPFRFEEPRILVERLGTALAGLFVAVGLTRWFLSGTAHAVARIAIYRTAPS